MSATANQAPVLVVGGGIGGLSAALALSRKGIPVQVLEQAPELKEIGAGIQLGPNVFRMFEVLDFFDVGGRIDRREQPTAAEIVGDHLGDGTCRVGVARRARNEIRDGDRHRLHVALGHVETHGRPRRDDPQARQGGGRAAGEQDPASADRVLPRTSAVPHQIDSPN